MAVDLGTAYISLVPTTKDFDKGIKSALDGTVKHADKTANSIGSKLAAGVTTHLDKAGAKSGDAFNKSFSPKVQSGGKSAMQGLANMMLGSAEGIGGEVGGRISGALTGALNKGAAEAISVLGSVGDKGGSAMSSKLQTAGMVAAGGVALVGAAAIAATTELYKIGAAWDDIADGITAKTGAIGDRLNAITDSVKKVAVDTAAAPGDIAKVTAELVQTLRLSGADLEMLTKQISDYNSMNADSPLNIRDFAKAMKQFGVTSADEMSKTLDRLNNIAQNTGMPLNELVNTLKTAAPVANQFKMPLETVTQLLATFEDAGLNAESAASALRIALGNLATQNPGSDPATALQNVITKIRELYQAGNETAAIDLAKSTFGKSFTQILPLIQENRLEVEDLNTKVAALGPTIEEQRQATSDFTEEWRKFRNFLEVELAPAAETVFGGIQNFLSYTVGTIAQNIRDLRSLLPGGDDPVADGPWQGGGGGFSSATGGIGTRAGMGGLNRTGRPIGTAGRGYFNSRAAAAQLDQQTDSFLLSNVPSGQYAQIQAADLTQGLADCSSAVEDLVNLMDGMPTAGRSMSTANAAEWLTSRGFRPGTAPGAFNVGFNSSHMQATLPGGTNFNWGSAAAAANRGIGGTGAFDPALTQRFYRYDRGGILPPGTTLVQNDTGKPELILNPEQQKTLAEQGVDPNSLLHGTGQGAAPGPSAAMLASAQQQSPDYGMDFVRSLGFIPQSAGNTGVAGTSSLAKFIGMGNEVVGGLIDTGTNLAQTAVSAAIMAGAAGSSFGAGAAAAPLADAAASYGIQLAGKTLKRVSSYGFQMLGIGADALMEQLFPFGAPRWLGYDYSTFAPQLGLQQAFTGTIEKMGTDAINRQFGMNQPQPGAAAAPVQPNQMPGMSQTTSSPPPGAEAPPAPAGPPPGTAPPATDFLKNLLPFDNGGMLEPGGLGVNLTNRPEPVLTPQQWDAIAAGSMNPAQGAPLVQNLYAQDMQDAIRQLDKVKRRDMMQYAGRP